MDEPITIKADNLQTIRLLVREDVQLSTKLKHVDIHQHWLRQEVKSGNINIQWVPTANIKANGFTKALGTQKFTTFVEQHLNLVDIQFLLTKKSKN